MLKTGVQKEKLLNDAYKKYETAIQYKNDYHLAYNNWGNTLNDLAKLKTGRQKEKLLNEACKKYEAAIQYKNDYHIAHNNLGKSMNDLAALKTGEQKEILLNEVCKKYETAIQYKNDYHVAYYNWGKSLTDLAALKTGSEKERYLLLALEKSKICKELGGKGYNLACAYALLEQRENALLNLTESLEKGEIDIVHVQQDSDWDNLRTEPEYLELIARFGN